MFILLLLLLLQTRALQPLATRDQLPYLHKPAVIVMMSFAHIVPTVLAAPILIMTSFSCRHSLLSWPCPALWMNVSMDTFPYLIYKDASTIFRALQCFDAVGWVAGRASGP